MTTTATERRSTPAPLRRHLPLLAGVIALATIAVGLAVHFDGTDLGTPLPPFLSRWGPDVDPQVLLAVALMAAGVWLGPFLLARPRRPLAFAASSFGVALALGLSLSASRAGTIGWYAVFDNRLSFEAKNEYLAALSSLQYGGRFFLDRFAELVPALPVHVAGHPPGLLLLLHAFDITTPQRLGALCIAAAAGLAPLTYAAARTRLADDRARIAALLVAFSPAVLVFGITSADAVFAAAGTACLIGLLARERLAWWAGAAALAVASLLSWALLSLGAIVVLARWRDRGLLAAIGVGAACAVAVVAFYVALYAATGFDPIGTVRSTEQVYRAGIASIRPYWFWLFGSPVAFGIALGLPIAWFALRAFAAGEAVALALGAVILLSAALALTKAETERIWLYLVPVAALAAATALPHKYLRLVLGLLAVQALAAELLFYNVW